MSDHDALMEAGGNFADEVARIGRKFAVVRLQLKQEKVKAVAVYLRDDHPLAPKLHDLLRALHSEAQLDGSAQDFGEVEDLKGGS